MALYITHLYHEYEMGSTDCTCTYHTCIQNVSSLTYTKDVARVRLYEYANMHVCSGILIGRSAPLPTSMLDARGHDSAHGEMTSWGRHNLANESPRVKLTLTTDIASRCKWRQLRPGGTTPDYALAGRGGRLLIIRPHAGETTTNQLLPSRVRRFYNRGRPHLANELPQRKSTITSGIAPGCKGRQLRPGGDGSRLPAMLQGDMILNRPMTRTVKQLYNTRSGIFWVITAMHSVMIMTRTL